jgi:hypothetical protein
MWTQSSVRASSSGTTKTSGWTRTSSAQLPLHDFVAVAVVRQSPHHVGGPVGRGSHAHMMVSSARQGQGWETR